MDKRLLGLLLVVGGIFLGSGGYLLFQHFYHPEKQRTVEVVQDNRVLYTFVYPTLEEKTIRIESPDGSSWNEVRLHDGTICMSDAGCPDLTCVHTGDLQYENLPIVCLPNKLVIRFADGEDIS